LLKKVVLLINPRILQLLAVFFMGLVMGSTYVNTVYSERIDTLLLENQNLAGELEAAREELEELKENLSQKGKKEVTGIELYVTITDNNLSKYEREDLEIQISKEVKKILEPLKGQPLEKLNYLLIPQIINHRVLEFNGRKFQLETKLLVIAEKIIIHINALTRQQIKEE